MSVDKLLRSVEAGVRLDLVIPRLEAAPEPPPLRVPPGRTNPALTTAAFGYLLRFELERRHPGDVRTRGWVAEDAPARLREIAPELAPEAERILDVARRAHFDYVRLAEPSHDARARLAAHALRLGRLDAAVRAGYADRHADLAEEEDVAELLAMLELVPWPRLDAPPRHLQPGLGRVGALVPHAEPDAILGGQMVVVRTAKSARVGQDDLRRLVVRLVLARAARADDPDFPEVRELSLYFARHGHLAAIPSEAVTSHPEFPRVERWLLRHAERVAGTRLSSIRPDGAVEPQDPLAPPPPRTDERPRWVKKRIRAAKAFAPPPEDKLKGKKSSRREGEARPEAPRRPPAAFRDAPPRPPRAPPRGAQEGAGEAPARKKPARPDWRKGSEWRRSRGL